MLPLNILRQLHHLIIALLMLPHVSSGQDMHFMPSDHRLGDVHPFFHEGECLLYYLKPGKYESALVRSRDCLRWVETPITHDAVKPED